MSTLDDLVNNVVHQAATNGFSAQVLAYAKRQIEVYVDTLEAIREPQADALAYSPEEIADLQDDIAPAPVKRRARQPK